MAPPIDFLQNQSPADSTGEKSLVSLFRQKRRVLKLVLDPRFIGLDEMNCSKAVEKSGVSS
jgi:hypothetical protein